MSHHDPDIVAVRELSRGAEAPIDESVARTWRRITAVQYRPAPRRRFRLLVPVTAATVVAGLAIGTAVVLRPTSVAVQPGLAPASAEAVAALNALAKAAAAADTPAQPLQKDQHVETTYTGWRAMPSPDDLDGPRTLTEGTDRMKTAGGGVMMFGVGLPLPSASGPLYGLTESEWLAREEVREWLADPSLIYRPSQEWLDALPTDPAKLLVELRKQVRQWDHWSTDDTVWIGVARLYAAADLRLTPELRVALLRALTRLRGLTAADVVIDGRRLIVIRRAAADRTEGILFDPTTGRAVGLQIIKDDVTVARPLPPDVADGVVYQATWTQKIMNDR